MIIYRYLLSILLLFALTCCDSDSQEDPSPDLDPDTGVSVSGNFVFLNSTGIYLGKPVANKIETTLFYDRNTPAPYPNILLGSHSLNIDQQHDYVYWSSMHSINRAPLNQSGNLEVVYDYQEQNLLLGVGRNSIFTIDETLNKIFILQTGDGAAFRRIYEGKMDGSSEISIIMEFGISYPLDQSPFYRSSPSDLHYYKNKLYWIENSTTNTKVIEYDITSKTLTELFNNTDGLKSITDISIDGPQNKIYISDKKSSTSTGIIYSGNLDGSGALTAIADGSPAVYFPKDMSIDAKNGYLFWINTVSKVGVADLMRMDIKDNRVDTLKIIGVGGADNFDILID